MHAVLCVPNARARSPGAASIRNQVPCQSIKPRASRQSTPSSTPKEGSCSLLRNARGGKRNWCHRIPSHRPDWKRPKPWRSCVEEVASELTCSCVRCRSLSIRPRYLPHGEKQLGVRQHNRPIPAQPPTRHEASGADPSSENQVCLKIQRSSVTESKEMI